MTPSMLGASGRWPRVGRRVALLPRGVIDFPRHAQGGFDHGDVHLSSGRVYVAHTATGSIEVIDGDRCLHRATLGGCPEASGVLCAQGEGLVFAAARGDGRVLVIQAASDVLLRQVLVGAKPCAQTKGRSTSG